MGPTDPTLVLGRSIGHGIFGTVHRGKWGRQVCAVKKFRHAYAQDQRSHILHEISIMERLRHQHVIQYYGTTHHRGSLVIISELAEGGSLQDALHSALLFHRAAGDNGTASDKGYWPVKSRLIQEIANGLAYVHDQGVLHRNLRTRNIILTKEGRAKLTSFALAAKVDGPSAVAMEQQVVGSARWVAPELLSFARPLPYTVKSDMYSFGMVMWELAAHSSFPYPHLKDDNSVFDFVRAGGRELIPDHTPLAYRLWIERCFDPDPANRPKAEDILEDEDDDF